MSDHDSPSLRRRTLVKATVGVTTVGLLAGCAETDEDDEEGDGMEEDGDGMEEEEE